MELVTSVISTSSIIFFYPIGGEDVLYCIVLLLIFYPKCIDPLKEETEKCFNT